MQGAFRRSKVALMLVVLLLSVAAVPVIANAEPLTETGTYVVQPGDTLWKIAVKFEVGLSELIAANSHIANPDLIYPYQSIRIPGKDAADLSWEQAVVQLVNEERSRNGLKPLASNWELSRVARYKSADMRDKNYFSHTSPTYGSPFDMMNQFGIRYRYAGENIAAGQTSPKAVMEAWMNSPGHRANILNPNFTEIGVGYVDGGYYRHYWTQHFTG